MARWLAKTAMLLSIEWERLDTIAALQNLLNTGQLSARTAVWIGQAAENVVKGTPPQDLVPEADLIDCFSVPWGTWALPVRWWRLSCLLVVDPPALDWPIELPIELGSRFVRIWPPHDDVIDWPPPVIIDRPTDEAFPSVFTQEWPSALDYEPEDVTE